MKTDNIYQQKKSLFIVQKSSLIVLLFTVLVFMGNPPWPFWENWFYITCLCVLLTTILLFNRFDKKFNKHGFIYYTLILLSFFVLFKSMQKFRTSSVVTILVFLQLFYITDEEKESILNIITTIMYYVFLISLPLWLINQFVYELPCFAEMTYGAWKGDGGKTILRNYIFFVDIKDYFRFYSIFDEPGVIGTISSFLLFANRYNFKDRRNIIILIASIFTFSLAFYILTLFSITLYNITRISKLIKIYLFIVLITLILFFSGIGRLAFSSLVFDRIQSINSSMDSRTSQNMKQYFSEYIKSKDAILGKGIKFLNNEIDSHDTGYRYFLIENGILGFILILFMYIILQYNNKYIYNRNIFIYFMLFLISFFQRPNLFTPWQLIIFSSGISVLSKPKNIIYSRKLSSLQ